MVRCAAVVVAIGVVGCGGAPEREELVPEPDPHLGAMTLAELDGQVDLGFT